MAATMPAGAQMRQTLPGHVPVAAVAVSRAVAPLPRTQKLQLAIGLPLRNQAQLDQLLADLGNPGSPRYRQYLTPAQFAARFAPSQADYQAVIQFAQAHGLQVTGTHPNRILLDVEGDTGTVETAFHVNLATYRHPVRGMFYAPDREPSLDLSVQTLDISGLDNFELPRPLNLRMTALNSAAVNEEAGPARPYVTGSGPGGYFLGRDLRAAYAPDVKATGAGEIVGLLEFDGFYPGDVAKNAAQAGVPVVPLQTVLLNGVSGAAGNNNVEVTLDIMMASSMAPGLQKEIVYEGAVPNDILNRMATDNLARQLSSSWGFGGMNATTQQIFKQYAAQGQSMMQASGDSGAYTGGAGGLWDDPALTLVGGTSLTTAGAGGPWQGESAWSGSGGGVSTSFAIPAYQQPFSMAANGGSTRMRNIPDVALTADVQLFLVANNGQNLVVGGTSAAAPLWAGFTALANQQAAAAGKPRVGFLNPQLYAIAAGSNYSLDFHDVRSGNNNGFSAVSGYDLATGLGSPAGQHLIDDLAGAPAAAPIAPSFTLGSSASALSLRQGGSGAFVLTVTGRNGFNGSVALAASGLPAGLTRGFSPAATTGTSTFSLTAAANLPAGTYPIIVTGVSGSLSSTLTLTVTVLAPGFTLAATPNVLAIARGGSVRAAVAIAAVNGWTRPATLSAAGLPAGVTAVWSPATTASGSTLTLNAGPTVVAGTYPVTVTGVAGNLHSTTALVLVVSAPGFALAFAPSSLDLLRGGIAKGTVTILGQGGFAGPVALSVTGLPAGVSASASPVSTGTPGTVLFSASTSATTGSFPVVLHGAAGSWTASTAATLVVRAPLSPTATVNLAPAYNVNALVLDGQRFSGPGLDGGLNGSSTAYSANLLGAQKTIGGTAFVFGPANALDAVSGKTVALPAGQFTSLQLLATGINGDQPAQLFRVTYTDGTIATFTQGVSDWFAPQGYAGETRAIAMPYRDNGEGQRDNRTFSCFGYSFALLPGKTVKSLALPNNRNVVVLAATLNGTSAPAPSPAPRLAPGVTP